MLRPRHFALLAAATGAIAVSGAPAAQAALRAPALQGPAAAGTVDASPTLTWATVAGAERYELQLSADRAFGSVVATVKTRNTAATLKGTLIDGTYVWRVRAISAARKAGRWSTVRTFDKHWKQAPQLVAPTTDFGAVWPSAPLVLRWSAVPHATSYTVVVATDPSLAEPVLGGTERPQTTQGTVLALPGTLNAGTYYWQITPVDGDGHKGTPSPVGRFGWSWPSGLTVAVKDLNPAVEVFDPLLTWSAVPGAGRYDVEVNTTPEFTPGSGFYKATVFGTAVAPVAPVPNNTYFWRVRAVDPDGRAGAYVSGTFRKEFDDVQPDTVPGLTVREGWTDSGATPASPLPAVALGAAVKSPVLTWSPVPGAAEYEVQVAPRQGTTCNWLADVRLVGGTGRTPNTFLDVAKVLGTGTPRPGPLSWPATRQPQHTNLVDGEDYCVRILARDGAGVRLGTDRNDSRWTYRPRQGAQEDATGAFTYTAPAPVADPPPCPATLPQPAYVAPATGTTTTPFFQWSNVPGAKSYFVVVARDDGFTEIKEVGFTDRTYYAPTSTFEDEDTNYYWAVWPSPRSDGQCFAHPAIAYPGFDKTSAPPVPQSPAPGTIQADQPIFSWLSAEGAADYRIQVARDAEFRDLVDDVTTASTTYASAGTYPVDTALYWRVRARDANQVELNWSAVNAFRRTLPAPVTDPGNPATGATIPVLSWSAVPGAISYGLHVDKVDGGTKDFTVATPRFTPTEFYGNGIWKWKVRANFPASGVASVAGPYTAAQDYVRRLLAPANPKATITAKRVLFTWDADPSGRQYRLDVARDDSFTELVESVRTPNTSYAPLLEGGYADGGRLYWRVAVQDQGDNLGAYARGMVRLPERLTVKVSALIARKHAVTWLTVTVTDLAGRRVRGSVVRVSGAGVSVSGRTRKNGTVTLRVRPRRTGPMKVAATRRGYVAATAQVRAY